MTEKIHEAGQSPEEASAEKVIEELSAYTPEALLRWAQKAYGVRAGIITSFQDTGCAIVSMMRRAAPGMRVITIDTLRLHEETYAHIRAVESLLGITVERYGPDMERIKRMEDQHGEFLFFDSKVKQEYCCKLRKVEPNQRALDTLDVWFTGLRRDQSPVRNHTPRVQWVTRDGRRLLKIAPLADWTQQQVEEYLLEHQIPRNPLMAQGYASIGCQICTTPVLPHESRRAGRWRWFNYREGEVKECGIHIAGSGI